MRVHRIIFLAAIMCATGCATSKKDVEAAKRSAYDAEFAVIYAAALEATREAYAELQDAPGRGAIQTAWHKVSYANNQDDLANPRTVAAGQGASTQGASMPTRLAYKRYFVRFDVSIAGGRPWRLKVVGHAAEWEPGAAMPSELHGVARPAWLEGRTEALIASIYKRIKAYAVPMKEQAPEETNEVVRADPAAFKDVPPGAAKQLATLKDALGTRDYTVLRAQLADDVLWSLGGGTGADTAMAMWQADPEPLDAMSKLLSGCAGDAKKVMCPAGTAAPGTYQLTLEPRGAAWRVVAFVRAE
jgi:dipeptidyl aminopeptidase/acylaminoacyl peptidase